MGLGTNIPWCHYTFNSWHGCTPVDNLCTHCYARNLSARNGEDLWGAGKPRRYFPLRHWRTIIKMQHEAAVAGEVRRVFVGSMCDIFDPEVPQHWRRKLWDYLGPTPNLIKIIATKRPEHVLEMFPQKWLDNPRDDFWLLTSVGDEESAKRLRVAATLPFKVLGISYEPAIGPVNWRKHLSGFNWLICGGESIGGRKFEPAWARDAMTVANEESVPFYMKQVGSHMAKKHGLKNWRGEDPNEWPEDLRVREFPEV